MKYINFEVDNAEILEQESDSQFATARVQAFASDKNKHDMYCSEETLQKTASSIFNKPILYNINKMFDDFGSHTEPEKSLIAGFVVPGSAEFVRLEDSRLSLSVVCKIWKKYTPKVIQLFSRDSKKKVSVEMELLDKKDRPDGLIEMLDFVYSGICILGDMITEASPGANMEMLSFSEENEKYKQAYQAEFSRRYDDVDFRIPESIRSNAEKGLALYKQYNKGGTSVSLASARYIVKNSVITPEKAKQMAKFFPKHKSDNFEDKEGESYIAWMLWGGSEGWKWSQELCDKIDEIDSKNLNYFGESITFPYDSMKDVNPSLKGIDPPITLGQANAIARQADAIGSDEKKNGWAIAIANFKKTHVVEDGKWVERKKDMNEDKLNLATEDMEKKEDAVEAEKMSEEGKEPEKEEMAESQVKEEPKEEETPEEEDKEEKKEEMSLDANLDVAAMLAMLQSETESYEEIVAEFAEGKSPNFAKVCNVMYSKMCNMAKKMEDMEAQNIAYMAENAELKKFKEDIEKDQFDFEVSKTLKDVEGIIPTAELEELVEKSKTYSLENLEGWKNSVKATAFTFSAGKKQDDEILHIALPFNGRGKNKKDSLWG